MASFTLVDTADALTHLIDRFADLQDPPRAPSLFLDLEGVKLCRNGSVSILQIYCLPHRHVYLIDVTTLGESAFTTTSIRHNVSLKHILESPDVPKVLFDVRNDADALYNIYAVSLSGVIDLQLMELATRPGSKRLLNGLSRCIQNDSGISFTARTLWSQSKDRGIRMFAPEHGGSYEVFNERPLRQEIIEYCAEDVKYLPELWTAYYRKITPGWMKKVEAATEDRLKLAQNSVYLGEGRHRALGPW